MHKRTMAGERTVNEHDFGRLERLGNGTLPSALAEKWDGRAFPTLIPSSEVPATTVTMYSQVEVRDIRSQRKQRLTLCYPHHAQPNLGFISVLSPVGSSLLGLSVGAIAHWQTPHGDHCAAEISALLFQPEASGDYTT